MGLRRALSAVLIAACLLLGSAQAGSAASLQLVNEIGGPGSGPGQLSANVEDLQVAPGGDLVVSDAGNYRLTTFTPGGSLVRAFGSSGSGPGQFSVPSGVAIQADGTILVVDSGHGRVEVFTARGAFVRQFPVPQLFYAGMALNPASTILYLVDYQSGNIQLTSKTGAEMGLFGSYGTGTGQFRRPFGIAVDSSGNLYVADRDNNRVLKLGPTGAYRGQRGGLGSGPGQMRGPVDVAIGADGHLLVADTNNFRLLEFTPAGQLVASYDRIAGSPTPSFVPWAVTAAPSGDIYVFDRQANAQRIVRVRTGPSEPVLGKSVSASELSGTVLVNTPGGGGFVPLDQARGIPVGSVLDTRRGKVGLTSARDRQGHTQTGQFGGAVFKVRQGRHAGGLTELALQGGKFGRCAGRAAGGSAARASKRVIRKLSARARRRGRFRTRGRYSASTVRGTVWETIDRCDGTLTVVRKGTVVVRDLRRHRTVVVRAHHSYLAKAPGG